MMSACSHTLTAKAAVSPTLGEAIAELRELITYRREASELTDSTQAARGVTTTALRHRHERLSTLASAFSLSPFEQDVVLLLVGMAVDAGLASAFKQEEGAARPTFAHCLHLLPSPHWSAVFEGGPLRYWGLVELEFSRDPVHSGLRLDPRILGHLIGVSEIDGGLSWSVSALRDGALTPPEEEVVETLTELWGQAHHGLLARHLHLVCGDAARRIVARVAASMGIEAFVMPTFFLPRRAAELQQFCRRWSREVRLAGRLLLIEVGDDPSPEALGVVRECLQLLEGPALVSSPADLPALPGGAIRVDLRPMKAAEREDVWQQALGGSWRRHSHQLGLISAKFSMELQSVHAVSAAARAQGERGDKGLDLWGLCRRHGRPSLDQLAQRMDARVKLGSLVLPPFQMSQVEQLLAHFRQQQKVHDQWGFAERGGRGLGISALFAGPSGTGKTFAAEALAGAIGVDCYRVDLSAVVSKYIGETEKHLRRIFDAAERSCVVLLFDEADALFGKRSEVRDSHDRYANIEVSYLLQRFERYQGLTVLTTNLKRDLDPAFLRRLRCVVDFAYPAESERKALWLKAFPSRTPTHELDFDRLAKVELTGGEIRNVTLSAAVLAADAGESVGMGHLKVAVRSELNKDGRRANESQLRGWG